MFSLKQKANAFNMESAKQSLNLAAPAIGRAGNEGVSPAEAFKKITAFSHSWLVDQNIAFVKKIGDVYGKYINN